MDYRPRSEVEDDPSFKQIIPYVVFRSRRRGVLLHPGQVAGRGAAAPAAVARASAATSPRPTPTAGRTLDAYEMALRRELDEEVEIGSPGRIRRVGLINDDSTAGRPGPPRRGPPLRARAPRGRPRARTAWPRPDSSRSRRSAPLRDEFETWSQICIDALLEDWLTAWDDAAGAERP